ncbi:MAG: hypothetical protein H0W64_11120 [Gammaproteobacteria bacterium]|nr:hypothetical protein [Gammaproteobacteria bacterium]
MQPRTSNVNANTPVDLTTDMIVMFYKTLNDEKIKSTSESYLKSLPTDYIDYLNAIKRGVKCRAKSILTTRLSMFAKLNLVNPEIMNAIIQDVNNDGRVLKDITIKSEESIQDLITRLSDVRDSVKSPNHSPQVLRAGSRISIFSEINSLSKQLTDTSIVDVSPHQRSVISAESFYQQGIREYRNNNFHAAIVSFEQAVEHFEKIKDSGPKCVETKLYLINAYYEYANVLLLAGNPLSETKIYFEKIYNAFQNNNYSSYFYQKILACSMSYLGSDLFVQANFDEAIKYLKQAYQILSNQNALTEDVDQKKNNHNFLEVMSIDLLNSYYEKIKGLMQKREFHHAYVNMVECMLWMDTSCSIENLAKREKLLIIGLFFDLNNKCLTSAEKAQNYARMLSLAEKFKEFATKFSFAKELVIANPIYTSNFIKAYTFELDKLLSAKEYDKAYELGCECYQFLIDHPFNGQEGSAEKSLFFDKFLLICSKQIQFKSMIDCEQAIKIGDLGLEVLMDPNFMINDKSQISAFKFALAIVYSKFARQLYQQNHSGVAIAYHKHAINFLEEIDASLYPNINKLKDDILRNLAACCSHYGTEKISDGSAREGVALIKEAVECMMKIFYKNPEDFEVGMIFIHYLERNTTLLNNVQGYENLGLFKTPTKPGNNLTEDVNPKVKENISRS